MSQHLISAAVSPDLYRRVQERVAAEPNGTTSALVRRALEQYLTQAEVPIVSPGRRWELEDNDQASSDIRQEPSPITGRRSDVA